MRLRKAPNVVVFVRHKSTCDDKTQGEAWARCMCPKFCRWQDGSRQHKKSLHTSFWGVAEKRAAQLQTDLTDKWNRGEKDMPPPEVAAPAIREVIESFLQNLRVNNTGDRRIYDLTSQLAKLESFMAARGRSTVAEITAPDCDLFRGEWLKYWQSAWKRRNAQAAFKTFFKHARRHDLLDRFAKIDPPEAQVRPFTADEIRKQLAACSDDLTRLFIRTAVGTGMASIDLAHLGRETLERSNGVLRYRRIKTKRKAKKDATPVVHPQLLADLRAACEGREYVFADRSDLQPVGRSRRIPALEGWRKKIQRLQEACGLYEKGDVCHRYRDTFINNAFDDGYDTTIVADMAGDSVAVIEKHYRLWSSKPREEFLLSRVVPRQL